MSEQETRSLITRLAVNYEIPVVNFEASFAKQVHDFLQWIDSNYKPVRIHKELPLMMESGEQFINGIADLVIETENEVVLIDYKTFNGNEQSLRWRVWPGSRVRLIILLRAFLLSLLLLWLLLPALMPRWRMCTS